MRIALALALTASTAIVGTAAAETWKGYSTITPKNIQWSYDADYSYRDKATGRIVVLTAAGKVGASPRIGPSAPGAPDGAGAVVALDCRKRDLLFLSGYSPNQPLAIKDDWRRGQAQTAKKDPDNVLLMDAVCPAAASLPEK